MKKGGRIEDVISIEKAIRDTGCFTCALDSSVGFTELFGLKSKSPAKVFTRVYEVYLEERAKELICNNDLLVLFDIDTVYIRFWFDHRNEIGEIKIKPKYVDKIFNFIPSIKAPLEDMYSVKEYKSKLAEGNI